MCHVVTSGGGSRVEWACWCEENTGSLSHGHAAEEQRLRLDRYARAAARPDPHGRPRPRRSRTPAAPPPLAPRVPPPSPPHGSRSSVRLDCWSVPVSRSSSSRSPRSRRRDGEAALRFRDPQTQLGGAPRELPEARRPQRVSQPRLRRGWSGRQPGERAGQQLRSAAAADAGADADAAEAAGRSSEQIHQPDPRLAEQVRAAGAAPALLPRQLHFYLHVSLTGGRGGGGGKPGPLKNHKTSLWESKYSSFLVQKVAVTERIFRLG